jgi:hypothetical protein
MQIEGEDAHIPVEYRPSLWRKLCGERVLFAGYFGVETVPDGLEIEETY